MAKTLIVGATGHLGHEILDACKKQGHEVHALVRPATRGDATRIKSLQAVGATIHEGDLKDYGSLVNACKAVDNVISVIGSFQIGEEGPLVKAVKEGRITFHWNEAVAYGDTWSVPTDNPAGDDIWAFIASMQAIDKQLDLLASLAAGPVTEEAAKATPAELRRINPTDPDNWKLQSLMDANWWADNYDQALAEYTDTIAG